MNINDIAIENLENELSTNPERFKNLRFTDVHIGCFLILQQAPHRFADFLRATGILKKEMGGFIARLMAEQTPMYEHVDTAATLVDLAFEQGDQMGDTVLGAVLNSLAHTEHSPKRDDIVAELIKRDTRRGEEHRGQDVLLGAIVEMATLHGSRTLAPEFNYAQTAGPWVGLLECLMRAGVSLKTPDDPDKETYVRFACSLRDNTLLDDPPVDDFLPIRALIEVGADWHQVLDDPTVSKIARNIVLAQPKVRQTKLLEVARQKAYTPSLGKTKI